jgi:molybdopterin molybdotransferase
MVTVGEASAIIFNHLFHPGVITVNLLASTGKVLAEPVLADRDFPPFNRVSMDGIGIQYEEWIKGRRTFLIEGIQAAGEEQKKLSDASHCMEVMTGAILPAGCDAVIRYEDVEIKGTDATIRNEMLMSWQSIHKQSMDARKDQVLLEPGVIISPSEVALLASVGKSDVAVYAFPRAAIISTGDELVEIDALPKPHQIRRSNSYALQSAMIDMGWDAVCFHLDDEKLSMEKALSEIVQQYDVIILSGGVSRGKFDFVPQVLESIGIRQLFHQVSQRPGKPFWFGKSESGKIAFALPGNPVSTFMCFYRYVKPWVLKSLGIAPENLSAILATDFSFPSNLTYFLQVSVKNEAGRMVAYPDAGGGSGDFANLKNVSGFLELPLEKNDFKAGEVYPYISFRH